MNRERGYLLVIAFALGLLVYVEYNRPAPINWSESYTADDKIPYGCYAARALLGDIFPKERIVDGTRAVYNMLDDADTAGPRNYIFINSAVAFDDLDVERLMEFVEGGSSVFIAATAFSGGLLDTLGIETRSYYEGDDDTLRADLVNPKLRGERPWAYARIGARRYFSALDSARTLVLGTIGEDEPNFIRVEHGAGAFYINTLPLAFTNYHLLDSARIGYPFRALSYLPAVPTIWDEHYKDGRNDVRTPLRYLLSQEALRWAYYLLLAGVGLFILVHARRRQRIIPEMAPPVNATLDFVETVGMLYLHGGDHAGIARKQITYLLEQMRSTYGVKTDQRGEELYDTVAKRSGVSEERVRGLFEIIGRIEGRDRIAEEDLMMLNGAIETFNNERER